MRKWPSVAWMFVSVTTAYSICDGLFGASFIVLLTARGFSASLIGTFVSLSGVLLLLLDYPLGVLADRFGRVLFLGSGLLAWSLSLGGIAAARSHLAIGIAAVLAAFAMAAISGTPPAWLYAKLAERGQEELYGALAPRASSLGLVASAGAAALGGVLVSLGGRAAPMAVACGVSGLAGVGALVAFPRDGSHLDTGRTLTQVFAESFRALRTSPVWRIVAYAFLGAVPLRIFILAWQFSAIRTAHVGPASIGIILGGLMLSMALGTAVAPTVVARSSPFHGAFAGVVLVVVGMAGLATTPVGAIFLTACVAVEVGLGMLGGSLQGWAAALIPSSVRTSVMSGISTAGSLSTIFAPIAIGELIDVRALPAVWVIGIGFSVVAYGVLLPLRRFSVEPIAEAPAVT